MLVYQAGYVPRITEKSWDLAGDIHHKEVGGPRMVTFCLHGTSNYSI